MLSRRLKQNKLAIINRDNGVGDRSLDRSLDSSIKKKEKKERICRYNGLDSALRCSLLLIVSCHMSRHAPFLRFRLSVKTVISRKPPS